MYARNTNCGSIVELPTDEVLVMDFRVGSALSVRRLPPR
jgi:hypothetical protein